MAMKCHNGETIEVTLTPLRNSVIEPSTATSRYPVTPHSFIHSFIRSFVHSFTRSLAHPLTRSPAHPLTRSPAHPLTRSPAHPLTRSPAHPLTRSPAHPLTRSPAHPLTRSRESKFTCRYIEGVYMTDSYSGISQQCSLRTCFDLLTIEQGTCYNYLN